MTVNRRKFIATTGAAVMAAPSSFSIVGWAWGTPAEIKKCGFIMVVDETIPFLKVYEQFDILRTHNMTPGAPFDEYLFFGHYGVGDGSMKYAKSCAKTCNGWIAGMRRYGFEKVAVMVWSRRYGPMLTIPLKTTADVMIVRTYVHPLGIGSAILAAAKQKQAVSHLTWLQGRMLRNGRPHFLLVDHVLNFEPMRFDTLAELNNLKVSMRQA